MFRKSKINRYVFFVYVMNVLYRYYSKLGFIIIVEPIA